jgi:beta-glucosidase-like glycosyl hydrolase
MIVSAILFFLACLTAFFQAPRFSQAQSIADGLASRGKLGIDVEAARTLEGKLGQLLIVNVDGFGYDGPLAVTPEFMEMVQRLQVGGVIPHYGTNDFQKIRETNRALAGLTRLPLLICSDIVGIRTGRGTGGKRKIARFGDGYVGGFIRQYGTLLEPEFGELSLLNGFVLASAGINVCLGPTVDDSTGCERTAARARALIDGLKRFGVEPVLKHYPFLPRGGNLHRESPDTRTPAEDVAERTAVFRELRLEAGMLMTTHLFDSLVDGATIATFSPMWRGRMEGDTGFSGLTMSDDILMLRNYRDRRPLGIEAEG